MKATACLSTRRILVVDDNPVVLKTLSLGLGARGYGVFTATDAAAAFAIARQEKLDLILLDIFFPPDITLSGMTWNAFQIIEWMQRIGIADGVPVIVISQAGPREFDDRCQAAGVVAFFQKPIQMPELLGTIREIFNPDAIGGEMESAGTLPPPAPTSVLPARQGFPA